MIVIAPLRRLGRGVESVAQILNMIDVPIGQIETVDGSA
jgi:hypothetical protein